ncbi:MAG: serine/threonine protein kinase, partial [Myxococcales bacterium]|nr:serine/threonine protein kinase [Myxococcales bacterium]
REALVLGRLRHPGIVDVIDYGHLENGWPFLILEFVEGGDLEALLNRSGPLSLQAGLDVLLQLARVLEYAHAQGVVHRDLKPGNILLRSGDHRLVKVIDFGLAKLMSAEMLTRLTTDGQIMGSPHYMAPEQAMGLPDISGAADIYALAGIAYVVMSGRPVFDSDSPLGLVFAQARHQPERLAQR